MILDYAELEMLCERYPMLTDAHWIHGVLSGRCMALVDDPMDQWLGFLLDESVVLSSSELAELQKLEQQIHSALGEGGFNFVIPDGEETDEIAKKILFLANWAEGLLFSMSLPPLSSLQTDSKVQELIKVLGELAGFAEKQRRKEIAEEELLSDMDYVELYEYVKLGSCYCYEQIKQLEETQH